MFSVDVDGRVHRRLSDPNCVVGNSDNGDSDNCMILSAVTDMIMLM